MKTGIVYMNDINAGILSQDDAGIFAFRYDDTYFYSSVLPPISITFPKSKKVYTATHLFPFFYGLLAEGTNKEIQCRLLRIDEDDDFERLLQTAGTDTIGAITVRRASV